MTIRILLVDERPLVCEALRKLLAQHDDLQVVAAAASAAEALREAASHEPQVALVGAGLPGDGVELARGLVAARPSLGVILVALCHSDALVRPAAAAGARGYVSSDACGEELARAVRVVAAGERYFGKDAEKLGDPAKAPADPLDALTPKERDIVRLIADGKSNAEAAKLMKLSPRTVETYRIRLMRKLDIEHLPALVKFAIRNGMATLD